MKRTKTALILVVPIVALLLLGRTVDTPTAEAKPTGAVTITETFCITLGSNFDWDGDGVIGDADDGPLLLSHCLSLTDQTKLDRLVGVLREIPPAEAQPTDVKPADFVPLDMDGGQLHEQDGSMYFIAFVSNDEPVGFYADEGIFQSSSSSVTLCGPAANPDSNFQDEDCDNDGVVGDGVVAAMLLPGANPDRGPATTRIRQGREEFDEAYTVVGEPFRIEFAVTKATIQTGAVACELFTDTAGYLATLGAAQKTPVTAKVTDDDGTVLTGALVSYKTDDPEVAVFTDKPLVPTLVSALGTLSPNVLCGADEPGKVVVTATITNGLAEIGLGLDIGARVRHASAEVEVKGPPTKMVLSASPASLACDGTATSTISATLTDAAGNPAADNNVVRFSIRALGTVNPIVAKSAGGAATTVLTPLSNILRGVTVDAKLLLTELNDDDEEILVPTTLEQSFLLQCSEAAPAAVEPGGAPAGPVSPTISPPATGDGGYLNE